MKNFNKQYPPQTGFYTVKVKNGRGWDAYSIARFHISVGQAYHEGEKFLATMEWAKHRFSKIIICVNDTLQRHNYIYRDHMSAELAHHKAEAAGREWIERNHQSIKTLPNVVIKRWDEWRSMDNYKAQYDQIVHLYMTDNNFRNMINNEIMEFWKRRRIKEGIENLSDFGGFKKTSTEYLLEETAAFFLMFRKETAVDIYPGSILLPCVLAEKYLDTAKDRKLGDRAFTRIDFSRNENSKKSISA